VPALGISAEMSWCRSVPVPKCS